MKRLYTYLNIRVVFLCLTLLWASLVGAYNPMSITRGESGFIITPDYLAPYAAVLPTDFNDIAFAEDGTPLMDSVYLFLSVNLIGDPIPTCVILAKTGNAYMIDLDDESYRTSFVMGDKSRVISDVDGKRLYITGTASDACAGQGKESEGFFYIKGGDSEVVDIYLDNVSITTKSKTLPTASLNDWMGGYTQGMACPIAIGPNTTSLNTNTAFTARFHIRGNNVLTGGATTKTQPATDAITRILGELFYLSAAPIAIRPVVSVDGNLDMYKNMSAKITFDDVWPTSADGATTMHTNGFLGLPVEGDLGAPSIDLGNSKGMVEFNGGQYKFHTPRNNSMFFVSSMAICYRSISMFGISTIGTGSSSSAGTSQEEQGLGTIRDVIFNDGTFSTYPAEKVVTTTDPKDTTKVDVVVKGWYRDYTDLRVPYNTKIYGGTFNNCNVYRCDASGEQGVAPINSAGKTLCRTKTAINESDIIKGIYTGPALETGYGSASLTPIKEADGTYYLYPYVFEGCSQEPPVYHRNWVTVLPQMGIKDRLTMGGSVTVQEKTLDNNTLENAYLFFTRLNQYTIDSAQISVAGVNVTVAAAISLGGGEKTKYADVTNSKPYTIHHGLYSMLSFNSNQWNMISLPYDVHNIYVMETTTPRQKGEPLETYLKRQGKADGNLAQNIVTSLCPDIFSGKGSGVRMNLIDIATKQINCPPFPIIPYDGTNAATSHFYLYEQVCDDLQYMDYGDLITESSENLLAGYGFWNLETTETDYQTKWAQVGKPTMPTTAEEKAALEAKGLLGTYTDQDGNTHDETILMRAGKIYSLFLPSDSMQYWNGKYLIFEGYGPQTIQGRNHKNNYVNYEMLWDVVNDGEDDLNYLREMVALQGNITFSNDTTDEYIYMPTAGAKNLDETAPYLYDFERKELGHVVYPMQVYAMLNEKLAEKDTEITRRGVIRKVDVTTDACPVVGDVLLYAYSQAGSIMLASHAEQYVQVVGVDGRMLFAGQLHDGEQKHIPATAGVYVVRSNDQAIKLLVP